MARFVFRLESVLTHRRAVEREKQVVVAGIEVERVEIEGEIRGHQSRLDRERREWREQLGTRVGGVDVRTVRFQASAAVHVVALAQRAVLKLAGVHARLERARGELIEAARQRKAVELLRERKHEEWRLAENRKDAAAMDEMSVIATARQLARGSQEISA